MLSLSFSWSLAFVLLLGVCLIEAAADEGGLYRARFKHEAVQWLDKRQDPAIAPPPDAEMTPTDFSISSTGVLTYITPSPLAAPIPITAQSQAVESFVPMVTFCTLPPLAYISGTFTNTATTGPYLNNSVVVPSGTGYCETSQSPTQTTICATTLTAFASKVTVTACEQNITFSSEYGYTIDPMTLNNTTPNATIIAPPTIRTVTTYYVASWQDLAATPGVPPQDVDKHLCQNFANGTRTCVVEYEEWHVEIVTLTTTTTSQIDVTATYPGPGQIIVHTEHWNITDTLTTFSLSSAMDVLSYTETESTSQGPRSSSTSSGLGTRTLTVFYNTPIS